MERKISVIIMSVSSVFLKHSSVLPAEQQREGVCLCLCYVIQSGSTSGRKKVDLYNQTAFQVICKMRNGTWLGMRLIQCNILYRHKYFIKYIYTSVSTCNVQVKYMNINSHTNSLETLGPIASCISIICTVI